MTAEWKKSAIERTKRKNDLAQAQAELKMLKEQYADAKQAARFYKDEYDRARKLLHEQYKELSRYDALRSVGVLIELDGEFKYLQGKDLDAFWEERDRRRNMYFEQSVLSTMQSVATPGSNWVAQAEL